MHTTPLWFGSEVEVSTGDRASQERSRESCTANEFMLFVATSTQLWERVHANACVVAAEGIASSSGS
jgi:hypothetical protein